MASMPPGNPTGNPPGTPPGRPPVPPPGAPGQPPYGNPYGPPYGNQRDYWRYQKEQNKAAWRAQRDMWRAQRDAARAQNRAMRSPSVAGPIVLITVGIVALLLITGHLNADQFWSAVERWWPMLLIALGLIALAEWAIDLRRENPPARHFGGYVWLVVLVVFLGVGGTGWHHWWGPLRAQFGDDGDDFFNSLGQPQHDLDQPVLNTPIPANAQVEIQDPRGDISITSSDSPNIEVKAHQVAYASNDTEANKIFKSQEAQVTVTGNSVLVRVGGNNSGKSNLAISLPRSASINVTAGRGGVTVAGVTSNVDVEVQHGDLEVTSITGRVHAKLNHDGDFAAHDINGDVTVDGNGGDLTISDVHGKVTLQGDFTGDTHLERADEAVRFHSSRTELDFARLPGDMSLNGDSMHATQVVGPVRVICTRSKDIEMNQVYGDTHVEDRDAQVHLEMAGSYQVEVKNTKGDVEVTLPADASASVTGHTHNGDIVSDFPLAISGDENKTVTGNIGRGGPELTLSTEHADLRIRKGADTTAVPPVAPAPKVTPVPGTPKVPGAPHLKAPKGATVQPVSQ